MERMSSPQISRGVVHIHCATHNPVEKFSHGSYLRSPLACPLIFFLSSAHKFHPSISLSVHLIKSSIYPSELIHLSIQVDPFCPSQSSPSKLIHPSTRVPSSLTCLSVYLSVALSHPSLSLYKISSFFFCQFHIHPSPSFTPSS